MDLTKLTDRRHLRFDAVTAEDMSIRWTDIHFGHRPEWDQKQRECMQTLFQGVAKHHGIDVAVVRQHSVDRDPILDAPVILSLGILYLFVAYIYTGRILVAVMVGNLGSIVIETFRLNSGHLSYRMNRIPFRQHWAMVFVCGFVVFGLVALMRSRFEKI